MNLSFDWPLLLVGLVLLLFLPRKGFWWLRLLSLAALLLALAGPNLERPGRDLAVLLDVSQSVGEAAGEALASFELGELAERATLYRFAGDASSQAVATPYASLKPQQTDLSRALQVASAGGASRILLLSDGVQSAGDALLALPDIPVDSYYVPSAANVRLLHLLVPDRAGEGERVEAVAVVESDVEADIVLRPSVGDAGLPAIRTRLGPGRTPLPFTFTARGDIDIQVSARLDVDFEQARDDDAKTRSITVSKQAPILVIDDPALVSVLQIQGLEVVSGWPQDLVSPLPYSAVVVRGAARDYTPGQLELLQRFVESGGGLMMTGGPESFGLGAWYRTPVEEVLPVTTDLRTDVEIPLVAMVIVLDRSQSMRSGNPSKIDLAKEGAVSVVELAYQEDRLGLISFSDEAQWIFKLRKASDRGKLEMLRAIVDIETQGGTILEPAYRQAIGALEDSDAAIKHIIILSDGRLYDGGAVFSRGTEVNFEQIAELGLGAGITTSTIAIGESADFQQLERMAEAGGGRYYAALDVSTLPRIFADEALTATRSLLREGEFVPLARSHPLLPRSDGDIPALSAYVASSPKKEAEIILEGVSGEPIFALSRQGLGRSAALTTDLNSWAAGFGDWSELPALLGTVSRWLQARPETFSASLVEEGSKLKVVVDAVQGGEYVNNQQLEARLSGMTRVLEQVAPGRYEGYFETIPQGGTALVINAGEVVARAEVTGPSGEFGDDGQALLSDISRLTGGQVLVRAGPYAPEMPRQSTSISQWFVLASLGLLLAELVLRRLWGRSGTPYSARLGRT